MFLVYSFYSQRVQDVARKPLTEVAAQVRAGDVTSIRVEGDNLFVELGNGEEVVSHKGTESTVTEQLRDLGVTAEQLENVEIDVVRPPDWMTLLSAIIANAWNGSPDSDAMSTATRDASSVARP